MIGRKARRIKELEAEVARLAQWDDRDWEMLAAVLGTALNLGGFRPPQDSRWYHLSAKVRWTTPKNPKPGDELAAVGDLILTEYQDHHFSGESVGGWTGKWAGEACDD